MILLELAGQIFNIVWSILCFPVYFLIARLFNTFIKITELDILSNTSVHNLYTRVTMIITIIMTFYIVFSIVKYTINPDEATDKEKGASKILSRIVIAIVLIAFVPSIFTTAYELQKRIIKSQIFSKVILGQEVTDYNNFGSSFAADTFSGFYRVDRKNCGKAVGGCEGAQKHVDNVINSIRNGTGTISILQTAFTGFALQQIDFDGLAALIFGCVAIYVLYLYCIDVGVRYVQLLFLQVISPIAIIGYIAPGKDNMFQKWLKQCITTYLDLFGRIAIMYFAIFMIQFIGRSFNITQLTRNGDAAGIFVYNFFVMGLLIFVQRAPKLLGELLPKSGAASIGFGLDFKSRKEPLKKSMSTIKKPIAATAGAVASGVNTIRNLKKGNLKEILDGKYKGKPGWQKKLASAYIAGKSAIQGGKDGAKSGKILSTYANRDKAARETETLIQSGGTPWGKDFLGLHYQSIKDEFKKVIDSLNDVVNSEKKIADATADTKLSKSAQSVIDDWNEQGLGNPTARAGFKKAIDGAQKLYAAGQIDETELHNRIRKAIDDSNVYAVIDAGEDAAGNKIYKDSNGRIVTKEQKEELESMAESVFKGMQEQAAKDKGSVEITILKQEIEHLKRVANAVKTTDKNGNQDHIKINVGTPENPIYRYVSDLSDTEFIEKIGDIKKAASENIVEVQYTSEYKAAEANANVPGKGDSDK